MNIMVMLLTCQVHLQRAVYGQYGGLLPFQLPPLQVYLIIIMITISLKHMTKWLLKSDLQFLHGSLDDSYHKWKHPSVWASVGLAVRDSNVSFGTAISPPKSSLFIYEIKKCILLMLCEKYLKSSMVFFIHTFSKKTNSIPFH